MARTAEDDSSGLGAGRGAAEGDAAGAATPGARRAGTGDAGAAPAAPSPAPPSPRRPFGREWAPIWVVAFVVYMLTLSLIPALTHDSLTYLNAINDGGLGLWHPHHLVYNAIGAGWLWMVRSLGVESGGLRVVASINAALGATSVALCYALLRERARVGWRLALAGTLGAASSFGFWFYSVSVEVYALSLATLLGSLYVLLSPRVTTRQAAAVGLLNGAAVLAHQINVLFAAVVVVVIVAKYRRLGVAAVRRWLLTWAAVATTVVVTAYGLVITLAVKPDSWQQAIDWFTRYAQADTYWQEPGASTVPSAAFGASRAVVGGHFMFRFGWFRDFVEAVVPGKSLTDEEFLVRNLPLPLAALLAVMAVAGGVLLALVLVRGVRRRRAVTAGARPLLLALVAWLVTYTLFFMVWEPTNIEFWIPQITCLWLAAAALSARELPVSATTGDSVAPAEEAREPGDATGPGHRAPAHLRGTRTAGRWPALLVVAAVLVGLTNLASILPARDPANDVYAYRFKALGTIVGPGDAVVVDRPHLNVGYNRRNTAAWAIPAVPHSESVDPEVDVPEFSTAGVVWQVQGVLDAGHRVAVDPQLVDDPASPTAEEVGELLESHYGDHWTRVEPNDGAEWLVIEPF